MQIRRRKTREVRIGCVAVGANNPIAIQSMAKTKTSDIENTQKQIKKLDKAGCAIVRLAVKDALDAQAIKKIKNNTSLPIVADIHFNWKLALLAIDNGADKIRLNPGNIYKKEQIREVVSAAKLNRIPIRVGANSGSLKTSGSSAADRLVKSVLDYIKIIEGFNFHDLVISLKGSDILDTIEAYRKVSRLCDYPLHLGVTATGASLGGTIKSSIAIGALLLEGIGDTIRVSLTDKPQQEVYAARGILEAVGLRSFGPQIISCPTCGRCEVDLIKIVKELERRLSAVSAKNICATNNGASANPCGGGGPAKICGGSFQLSARPMKLAVMGCEVNGPGEAKEADIGVAFGKKEGLLFKNGIPLKKVSLANCIESLLKEGDINA